MKGKMKGLGYELIIFGATFLMLLFLWIFGYGVFSETVTIFTNMTTNSTVTSHIENIGSVVYWSFFLIVILGVMYISKEAKKDEKPVA